MRSPRTRPLTPVGQIVAVGPGDAVVTRFINGAAYYSPDNRNLGGGGNTVAAAPGGGSVARLVQVGGGLISEFTSGAVYLSPTGMNLDGGNGTIAVPSWIARGNAPFGPQVSVRCLVRPRTAVSCRGKSCRRDSCGRTT